MTEKVLRFICGIATSLTGIVTYETFYPNNAALIYLTGVVVVAVAVVISNIIHNNHIKED